jgi:hypothetical protein
MSYTPKPWTIESIEGDNIVFDSNHHSICEVFYDGSDKPNAKLIAAAPDLLEALEEIFRTLNSDDTTICQSLPEKDSFYKDYNWIRKAKSAINKARGQ